MEQQYMTVTKASTIEGRKITSYRGIVVGPSIMDTSLARDIFASITDIVGHRSGACESELQDFSGTTLRELKERAAAMEGDAVVETDLDYEAFGQSKLTVSASSTALALE